jgi:Arc/MetJ-type ribon-helix-helix transcriptional regulator
MTDMTRSIRLSITQDTQLQDDVKKYHFRNTSECLRVCHELFRKFMSYKDSMNDPDVTRKFLEETEPLFRAEKDFDKLQKHIGKMTEGEMERIYFMISLERNSRVKTKVKTLEDNRNRLQKGGELEPRVAYSLVNNNGYEFYAPIDPPNQYNDGKEWKELSELDKITLRDELTVKLSELVKSYGESDNMTAIVREHVRRINEQLEKEKRMIR